LTFTSPLCSILLLAGENDEVEFACKTKEEDAETEITDKIKFQVKKIADGKGLTVKVKYEHEIETQDAETETETQYDVRFDRVIEYRKAGVAVSRSGSLDADMAYEWDLDTIVQELPLDNWQDFSAIVDEGSLSRFSIASEDNTTTFFFTIARDDSGNVTANKMKIDFELTDFPWTADDTFVALLCTVESGREVKLEVNDDSGSGTEGTPSTTTSRKTKDVKISFADAVDTINFTPLGEFEWADTAEVIGNSTNTTTTESSTIQVVATSPADETSDAIAFSFVGSVAHRAADIYWDPSVGVAYEAGSSSAAASGTGSSAAAFSLMGVASLTYAALVSIM
jgi:hypothetical protein